MRLLQVIYKLVILLLHLPVHRPQQVLIPPLQRPACAILELLHSESADLHLVFRDEVLDSSEFVLRILFVLLNLLVLRAVLILELLNQRLKFFRLRRQLRLIPLLEVKAIHPHLLQVFPQTHALVDFLELLFQLLCV